MKKILIFILGVFLMCSCGCGHKEGEPHTPNDTILCVVDKKDNPLQYNVVLHMMEWHYYVTVRNIENGNKRRIDRKFFYDMFNEGDTIYEVVHHCPYYKIELKKK